MRYLHFLLFFYIFHCRAEEWFHLELGAGNYGTDGHTKTSQAKTVLKKIKEVTNQKNYIDDLEATGTGNYKPEEQYGVLFWTLDQLVIRYGPVGVLHINDLYEDYATTAVNQLKNYAQLQGYDSVLIEAIPGDYYFFDATQSLSKYKRSLYTSIHLKNPEVSFYHDRMDGEIFSASEYARQCTRNLLKNLANLSEEGLYLFILDDDCFIPIEEKVEYMEKGLFYHHTDIWEPVPYILREGGIITEDKKVFHIKPS